ncbi:hypothetical protein WBG78_30410 [Chryseolinea sp. T2]|uniref:hypothetical protein n=1 Tax=Chryseolinea sp. T2 TaxID=3129255 RepID=UPI0030778E6B
MAKKIEWTAASLRDRVGIYRYWLERNKSDSYSEKLELLFDEAAELIADCILTIDTDERDLGIRLKYNANLNKFDVLGWMSLDHRGK